MAAKQHLKVLYLLLAATPILASTYLWLSYFLPVKTVQFYHWGYFGFALIPALLLSGLVLLTAFLRTTGIRVFFAVLTVPGFMLWAFTILVVSKDFKIH